MAVRNIKEYYNIQGISPGKREFLDSLTDPQKSTYQGIAGNALLEPVPSFAALPGEKVISGDNNSWIVLGRDRNASNISGYGGKGHTQCGSIDLVVGRMGANPREIDGSGEEIPPVNPNFTIDSARVFISQKSDVDDYFRLADGNVGNAKARSAVAIKADGVRIIGREGIKLVTRTDRYNSQNGEVLGQVGIDLIAGNDDSDLQPMVRGDNLAKCIDSLIKHILKLNGIIENMLLIQNGFNAALTSHFHISPFFGLPTAPSETVATQGVVTMKDHAVQTQKDLITHKTNLVNFKKIYLEPLNDKTYINSKYNNVN